MEDVMNTMKKLVILVSALCASQAYSCLECDGVLFTVFETALSPVFYIQAKLRDRKDAQVKVDFLKKTSLEKINYLAARGCTYEEMMSIAIGYEDLEFVQAIFEKAGSDIDLNCVSNGGVPYCEIRHDAIYRIYTGDTLLCMAALFADTSKGYEIVRLLLEHGANPNQIGDRNLMPLDKANNETVVALLKQYGAVA